jgi:hypothetical protein
VPFQTWGTTLTLLGEGVPSTAQSVNIYWGKRHQVERLTSTLPVETEETVLAGAAGFAALELSSYAVNRANIGGPAAIGDYARQGEVWLREFRNLLKRFGRQARVRSSQLYAPAQASGSKSTVSWE